MARGYKLSKSNIEEIKRLYKDGVKYRDIGQKFNIGIGTVFYWVKGEKLDRNQLKLNRIDCKEQAKILRKRILSFFGAYCVRCGFNDIRALQIDHINGGGCKETRKLGNGKMYRLILSGDLPRENYQLLCANCNWIKRVEKNELRKGIPLETVVLA